MPLKIISNKRICGFKGCKTRLSVFRPKQTYCSFHKNFIEERRFNEEDKKKEIAEIERLRCSTFYKQLSYWRANVNKIYFMRENFSYGLWTIVKRKNPYNHRPQYAFFIKTLTKGRKISSQERVYPVELIKLLGG